MRSVASVRILLLLLLATGAAAAGFFRVDASKSRHEFLRSGLLTRGWRELKKKGSSIEPGLIWSFRYHEPANERQVVNHFRNYNELCTKAGLLASLADRDTSAWFPRGHLWPRDMVLLRADFHRTVAACSGQDVAAPDVALPRLQPGLDCGEANGTLWIAKPAAGTRGVGIEVFRELRAMEEFLSEVGDAQFVVQKYIETPMLLFGRKFDLRLFVLVVSLDPLVAFCSSDAYVRFASAPFESTSTDKFAHLTNAQIQKYAPRNAEQDASDVARNIHSNQWSLESFRAHLESTYGEGTWERVIVPKLRAMAAQVVQAWPDRGSNHRAASFELLGLDVLLSSGLDAWLLEVNADPGLHVLTPVVEAHHSKAVEGLLAAVLERRGEWKAHPPCKEETCHLQIGPWSLVVKE